jgi:pimeloyl-ACP methyl ester carboxylesterase
MNGQTSSKLIAGGGHLLELDRPEETAQAIVDFASGPR